MKIATAQRTENGRIVGLKVLETETGAEDYWTIAEIKAYLAAGGELLCPDQYGGPPTPVTLELGPDGVELLVSWTPTRKTEPPRN